MPDPNSQTPVSTPVSVVPQGKEVYPWSFFSLLILTLLFGPGAGFLITWQNLKRLQKDKEAKNFLGVGSAILVLIILILVILPENSVITLPITYFFSLLFPCWLYAKHLKKWQQENPGKAKFSWSLLGWSLLGLMITLLIIQLSAILAVTIQSTKKTQLSQSPKPTAVTTVVKPSPTPSVIPITFPYGIKILENTISQKVYISPKSSPPDLQPELFDPKLSKLEKIREEGPDDKYVYMVPNKPINVWIEQLSLSEPFQTVVYHFSGGGSSVNSSEVIEITHNNERDFLFTHVKGYAFSPDNKSLFLTNYVKNKNEWVIKKRIIEIETKKQIELPNVECTSAHYGAWDKEKLITHSDANIQGGCGPNGNLTKVCLWDRNGKLLKQLEANYWWYAGSECYLGSDFGLLPQDDNIFYSVVVRPQVGCYIAVQDLNNQQRNRTFKFVEEDLKASSPHCPALNDVDFTNFNFSSQKIKYRTGKEGETPEPQSPWKEAIAEEKQVLNNSFP